MEPLVEVVVGRLGLDGSSNTYVVILQERGGDRLLPIWIGQAEAESILLEMNGVRKERPLTHDLCKGLIVGLGAHLDRVEITRVESRTYYAELHLSRAGEVYRVDARPSDSIAIALRTGSPMFASASLLAETEPDGEGGAPDTPVEPGARETGDQLTPEQLKRHLEGLRPEDFGKFRP
ncbi:MAG: bifunctional nuclease family protein [Gemmatimonadetes bacterium]|nr:bifunctional nuclease family protein [Gemmatimonadota bacterium]